MPQLRDAKNRWYGNAVAETIATPSIRLIHSEEAALYSFECDATLTVILPYETGNLPLGVFTRIVNDDNGGGGSTITIQDAGLNTLDTLVAGSSALIVLQVASGLGTWLILKSTGAFAGRTPLS